jgi:DNA-binding NtrC family response regulator
VYDRKIIQKQNDFKFEHYMGNRESILVVDDEENQREIASMILSQLNYAVATVQSGEEAIIFAKNNKSDLLVLDMMMEPGIDGLETYQEILNLNPKQKVVIASGFSETNKIKKIQRIGYAKYIKKPYSIEHMAKVIKSVLHPTSLSMEALS